MRKITIGLVAFVLLVGVSVAYATEDSLAGGHVIYLHGWIIQDQQDPRPEHPQFGYYELEEILAVFRSRGFTVNGEIRPKSASISESADRVVSQVGELLESGVPADRVLVVGASMGGTIAMVASERLGNPEVRFAVLGICLSRVSSRIREQEGAGPTGHILSIREASDRVTSNCQPMEVDPDSRVSSDSREIVLDTGLDHGFLYRPLPEWTGPVLRWFTVANE